MVLKVARRRRARNLTKTIWCVQPLSFSYTFEILLIALQPILKTPVRERCAEGGSGCTADAKSKGSSEIIVSRQGTYHLPAYHYVTEPK